MKTSGARHSSWVLRRRDSGQSCTQMRGESVDKAFVRAKTVANSGADGVNVSIVLNWFEALRAAAP